MSKPVIEAYINSFPKSGRTWVRYTFAKYFKLMYQIDVKIGFTTLGEVFSDLGDTPRKRKYEEFPNIVFSHLHPQKEQAQQNNIMIVRNTLDVMVSYYYHHDAIKKMGTGPAGALMRHDHFTQEYADYMNLWFGDQRNKLWVVQYEKLHDPLTWFDLIENLGHMGDSDKIIEAMMQSNFERMQDDELENPQVMKNWSSDPNHLRVRKGKIGGWKDELSIEEAKEVIKKITSKLTVTAEHALKAYRVLPEI